MLTSYRFAYLLCALILDEIVPSLCTDSQPHTGQTALWLLVTSWATQESALQKPVCAYFIHSVRAATLGRGRTCLRGITTAKPLEASTVLDSWLGFYYMPYSYYLHLLKSVIVRCVGSLRAPTMPWKTMMRLGK